MGVLNMVGPITEERFQAYLRDAADDRAVKRQGKLLLAAHAAHGEPAVLAMLEQMAKGELSLGPQFYEWLKILEVAGDSGS